MYDALIYTHNSATVWIYVLLYMFNCLDVIATTLHILNLSDSDINAFIHITDEGFITSGEEIMCLFLSYLPAGNVSCCLPAQEQLIELS